MWRYYLIILSDSFVHSSFFEISFTAFLAHHEEAYLFFFYDWEVAINLKY